MTKFNDRMPAMSRRTKIGAGAALLLALGAAGGAGAVSLTRPAIEMAPTVQTAIAKLPASSGVVTVKGRVAEVYGNRFVIQDQSGRTMVDTGRQASGITNGQPVLVQGRFDDGQLRASYLVGSDGRVNAVGPDPRGHGPDGPGRAGRDGPPPPPPGGPRGNDAGPPPPPPGGPGAPPPPPAGCAPGGAPIAPAGQPAPRLPAPGAPAVPAPAPAPQQ